MAEVLEQAVGHVDGGAGDAGERPPECEARRGPALPASQGGARPGGEAQGRVAERAGDEERVSGPGPGPPEGPIRTDRPHHRDRQGELAAPA